MRKLVLAAALLAGTALASNANAATAGVGTYTFNVSPDLGPGSYGTVTVANVTGTTQTRFTEAIVGPGFITNTGNHLPLTFNLAGSASIIPSSVLSPFSVGGAGTNPPFGTFTNSINGDCGSGSSSGGCGSTLSFLVNNFSGLISNTVNGAEIFFASDLSINGRTGAAGATFNGTVVPLPPAVALFLSGLVGIGALKRFTKKKAGLA